MGAIISIDTDRTITIIGTDNLKGAEHSIIPDRLEAASWACAALVTDGKIYVHNARQLDMTTFLNTFKQIGGQFEVIDSGITFSRGKDLRSAAIETDVYPGFNTDLMQPLVVALTQTKGASIIHETVYENRFSFVSELQKMGSRIQLYRECLGSNKRCRFGRQNHYHSAVIMGPTPLLGASISVPDLRAGMSYVIAALGAKGMSTIEHIDIIGRGYEHFIEKIESLGADIIDKDDA
jgi:UDP-N-acetylglucosamine 1-carboxyvinyltransferase